MDILRIYCVTWNVEGSWPEQELKILLNLETKSADKLPDIFCICLQEVRSQPQNYVFDALFEEPWTTSFRECLAPFDYVRITGERLQGLVTNVFVLRKHVPHLRDIFTTVTRTGLGGFWGNKGGACVRFSLYGCSFCIVNSHLAAHDVGYEERCLHYNTIIDNTKFPINETSNLLYHDYVFWLGDLNFRLTGDEASASIVKKILANELDDLLEKDELKKAQQSNEAFGPLTEARINFRPTYKHQADSVSYDLNRRPAWTDRILHQVHKDAYENVKLGVDQLCYTSVPEYTQSDHKPVKAIFHSKVFSHHLERCVTFKPIKQWVVGTSLEEGGAFGREKLNIVRYSIDSDVIVDPWDYIALYKANFDSVHQFVTYNYVPQVQKLVDSKLSDTECTDGGVSGDFRKGMAGEGGREFELVFGEDLLMQSMENYVLIYYSGKYHCYLGMSDVFPIIQNEG